MQQTRLSTPEASKALGIPVHVITYWLGQIPYPAEQDAQGQWRLTHEALAVLQTVKTLKEQNHSMESIRRHVREIQDVQPASIAPPAVVAPQAPVAPKAELTRTPPAPSAAVKPPASNTNDLVSQISRAVSDAVRQETTLAQRYAHAAHHIGKIETENKHLRAMLADAKASRDEARMRLAEIEAKPAPKAKTSWWSWMAMVALL